MPKKRDRLPVVTSESMSMANGWAAGGPLADGRNTTRIHYTQMRDAIRWVDARWATRTHARCKMQACRHGVWQVMGMPASPLAAWPLTRSRAYS